MVPVHLNSCAFSCHSSDKRLYFADNSGYEHDSIKPPPETPLKISRRNFWCNKNFFQKKFQIEISPEVYHKIRKFSIVGLYFDQLYTFLNSIHRKITLIGQYQIFVTRVTKEGATVIGKNEGATVKKLLGLVSRKRLWSTVSTSLSWWNIWWNISIHFDNVDTVNLDKVLLLKFRSRLIIKCFSY